MKYSYRVKYAEAQQTEAIYKHNTHYGYSTTSTSPAFGVNSSVADYTTNTNSAYLDTLFTQYFHA